MPQALSKNIARVRKAAGLTQKDVADKASVFDFLTTGPDEKHAAYILCGFVHSAYLYDSCVVLVLGMHEAPRSLLLHRFTLDDLHFAIKKADRLRARSANSVSGGPSRIRTCNRRIMSPQR